MPRLCLTRFTAGWLDQSVYSVPFNYDPKIKIAKLRIGYSKTDFEKETGERKQHERGNLEKMRALAPVIPVELPEYPLNAIPSCFRTAGAACLRRPDSDRTARLLKQQGRNAWPNRFGEKRFVPAVDICKPNGFAICLIQTRQRCSIMLIFVRRRRAARVCCEQPHGPSLRRLA